jgi:hypothetical protein
MAARPTAATPVALRLAAVAQAAEAVGMAVAAVFAAVATADGQSYQLASGIALTLIALGTAAGLAAFAVGLYRARAWSRTPVVMTQLFVGGAGLYLVTGHRWGWGVPALALAAGCLAGVFTPASLRALNRPPRPVSPPAEAAPVQTQVVQTQQAKRPPAKNQPAKNQPPKNQPAKNQPAKNQPPKRPSAKNQQAKRPAAKGQPAKKAAR